VQGETEMWCRRDGLGQLLQRHGTCRQNARWHPHSPTHLPHD
jgi:hypothetical protein